MRDFGSLGAFAAHLAAAGAQIVADEADALDRAARIVQNEAKGSLGEYQPQSGPFAAWAPLAPATIADRVSKGFAADEPELRTGRMRETIEYTVLPLQGSTREAEIGSDDDVLMFQELGTPNMPPRSIMGGAGARVADQVARELGRGTIELLTGGPIMALIP